MYLDKTQYDTKLDLSLYIEGLLNTDEQVVKTQTEEKLESIILNDFIISEIEEPALSKEEKVTEAVTITKAETEKSSIPSWGEKPFECLLVKSAGMSLMIPAMSVSYIERVNKKIIRLPLEVKAFRGVVTLRKRSVAVIDLFDLISESSSEAEQQLRKIDEHHIEHVIVMEGGHYALACDDIGEMVTLDAENVRWNKASFNNPMFSGIVPEYLCPLVNINNIQQQVAEMPFVQSLKKQY